MLHEIIYLRINSSEQALDRIATRVAQGGHDIPREDVLRRFDRSWNNFLNIYCKIADKWLSTKTHRTYFNF